MTASTWFRRLGRSASPPEFSAAQRSNACRSGFRSESLDPASAWAASGVRHAVPGLWPALLWLPLLLASPAPAAAQTIDSTSITEGQTKNFTVSGIPSSWTGTPSASLTAITSGNVAVSSCPATIDTLVPNWDVCLDLTGGAFNSGTRAYSFRLRARQDSSLDDGETFRVTVEDGDDSSRSVSFTITISDVAQPTVTITGGAAVTEGGDATFTLALNTSPTANLQVGFTV